MIISTSDAQVTARLLNHMHQLCGISDLVKLEA
jgi:hypothetical protein